MAELVQPRLGRIAQLHAYLTLTRPANVATALADVLAGAAVSGGVSGLPGPSRGARRCMPVASC